MEGTIKISKEEVREMVTDWVKNKALTTGNIIINQIKIDGYANREPALEIEFTNQPLTPPIEPKEVQDGNQT